MTLRFINADAAEYSSMAAYSLNDTNLFTYCGNNPVIRADDGGDFWHIVIGAAVGAVIGFASSVASDLISGEEIDWTGAAISAGIGALEGALTAACPAYAVVISATASAVDTAINSTRDYVNNGEGSIGGIIGGTIAAAGIGALTGKGNGVFKSFKTYGDNVSRRIGNSMVRNGKKILNEGLSTAGKAFSNIAGEFVGATKYYFSQTGKHHLRNLLRSDVLSLLGDTAMGVIDNKLRAEILQ